MRTSSEPLIALDRAIELLRCESWVRLLGCAAPMLVMTWLSLLVYCLEWIEGARGLRPALAVSFALTYCVRTLLLSRFAGQAVDRLLAPSAEPTPEPEPNLGVQHAPTQLLLRIAIALGAELWLWSWLLVLVLRIHPWLVAATLPLLSLRGALLPSAFAACDCAPRPRVGSALAHAFRAAAGQRLLGVALELLLLAAGFLLALNLGALAAALVALSQDLLGLELAFVRAFVSPRNSFALLVLAGLSASALEPLRAALSAVLYADYRRAEGALELRALIERCVTGERTRRASAGKRRRALIGSALVLLLARGARVHAQAEDDEPWAPEPLTPSLALGNECDEVCREARQRDDAMLVEVVSILERPEFREFPDQRFVGVAGDDLSLDQLVARFMRWLLGTGEAVDERGEARALPRVGSVRVGVLMLIALGVGLFAFTYVALRTRTKARRGSLRTIDASQSAASARGVVALKPQLPDARSELRALYLAGLGGLSRRGSLHLASHATNGQYLRALRSSRERQLLTELTRLFERAQYGADTPSASELARAHELASSLSREELS